MLKEKNIENSGKIKESAELIEPPGIDVEAAWRKAYNAENQEHKQQVAAFSPGQMYHVT